MARSQSTPERLTTSELTIVDSDSHLSNKLDHLLPYLDPSVKSVIDRIPLEEAPWKIFSSTRATPDFPNNVGIGDDDELLEHEYATDVETKLEFMDEYETPLGFLLVGETSRGEPPIEHLCDGLVRLPYWLYLLLC